MTSANQRDRFCCGCSSTGLSSFYAHSDFTDWMSFPLSNLMEVISPNSEKKKSFLELLIGRALFSPYGCWLCLNIYYVDCDTEAKDDSLLARQRSHI